MVESETVVLLGIFVGVGAIFGVRCQFGDILEEFGNLPVLAYCMMKIGGGSIAIGLDITGTNPYDVGVAVAAVMSFDVQ